MSYISGIFKRLDIQHIREFLMNGVEDYNISTESYHKRLETAEQAATSFLQSFYTDNSKFEEETIPVYEYVGVVQRVYMEIGMQCGFKLAMQVLDKK